MANCTVVLRVSTSKENICFNPRCLGLCAGDGDQGNVFVLCNAVCTGRRRLLTSHLVASWVRDMSCVIFEVVGRKCKVVFERSDMLDECSGFLYLTTEFDLEETALHETSLPDIHENDVLHICGVPFGYAAIGCCWFVETPVETDSTFCSFGKSLCEGLEGALVIGSTKNGNIIRGIVIDAKKGVVWCPGFRIKERTSEAKKGVCQNNCVVGLVGGGAWATGVVVSVAESLATIITCAHFTKKCKNPTVLCNGREIGIANVLPLKEETTTLDVSVLSLILKDQTAVSPCSICTNPSKLFQSVYTFGFHTKPPHVSVKYPTIERGYVVRNLPNTLVTTCQSKNGSSGGVVVDDEGKVLAIQCNSIVGARQPSLSLALDIHVALNHLASRIII